MEQARLAAGWLKQKYKLLPVFIILTLVGTMTLPAFVQHSYAINDAESTSGIADGVWKDDYATLVYNGKSFTGGSGNNAVFKNGTTCPDTITFNGSFRTATSATFTPVEGRALGAHGGVACVKGTTVAISVDPTANNDAAGGTGGGTNADGTSDDVNQGDPCDASDNPLSWIVCPIVGLLNEGVIQMQNVIDNLMMVNVGSIFDTSKASGKAYYAAWNSFRTFGVVLIVIAGLVMVISQALGFEVFDAYTVKKVLPRLFIAAIGISLSWWLLKFLAQFTNDLGIGIRSIIYYPFRDLGAAGLQNTGSYLITAVLGSAALWALSIGGVLSLVATAGLAALIAFLVLILRELILIFLIILAPLAIACYVLPNTERMYKIWWDSLFKGMMMFPIITGFIALGRVFSVVASNTSSGAGSSINQVIALIAFFIPYFILPFTFRLAGGAIATIGGLANDRSRGGFDMLKNYRKGKTSAKAGYYGQRIGDRSMQRRANIVRNLNDSASKRGRLAGGAMRMAGRQVAGYGGIEHKMSAINARTGKELGDQIATGNDADIRGLTANYKAARAAGALTAENNYDNGLMRQRDGKTQYKSLAGAWIDESDVIEGHRKWGNDVAAQQAALSYEMRKAMTDDQVQSVSERYVSTAKSWGQTRTQAGGTWIGAAFENQNQHLEYKNTDLDWDNNSAALNAEKFSKEAYEKKGSYQLSQMSAHTISQLENAYKTADLSGDTATKQRLQAVAETFMSRYGSGGGIVGMDGDTPQREDDVARQGGRAASYQSNSQGAAHVAEAVRSFAQTAGVYRELDKGSDSTGPKPTIPPQN